MHNYIALLLLLPLVLSGCSGQPGIENRAYALALAMDREEDGALTLTVCVPHVGKSEGHSGAQEGDPSPYTFFSATGEGFAGALSALRMAVPRPLTLSHIVLLAVSQRLAEDRSFPELIDRLAETRNLYTATRVVVCPEDAGEFIRGEEPLISTRLSSEIEGALAHYIDLGAVPDTCLSDLYCTSNDIYGDIAVACGSEASKGEGPAEQPGALLVPDAGGLRDTPAKRVYAGCAIFSGGQMRARLDASDTLCINLLNGSARHLSVRSGGRALTLTVGSIKKRVAFRGGAPEIRISVALSALERLTESERTAVERALAEAITHAVHACQARSVEPLQLGERAARRFATLREWQDYDWRGRFAAAPLTVRVALRAG